MSNEVPAVDYNKELEKLILSRLGVSSLPELIGKLGVAKPLEEKVIPESIPVVDTGSDTEKDNYSLISQLGDKELLLLKLFNEFTKKDEGRVLASELGKFARYVQSEVSKSAVTS